MNGWLDHNSRFYQHTPIEKLPKITRRVQPRWFVPRVILGRHSLHIRHIGVEMCQPIRMNTLQWARRQDPFCGQGSRPSSSLREGGIRYLLPPTIPVVPFPSNTTSSRGGESGSGRWTWRGHFRLLSDWQQFIGSQTKSEMWGYSWLSFSQPFLSRRGIKKSTKKHTKKSKKKPKTTKNTKKQQQHKQKTQKQQKTHKNQWGELLMIESSIPSLRAVRPALQRCSLRRSPAGFPSCLKCCPTRAAGFCLRPGGGPAGTHQGGRVGGGGIGSIFFRFEKEFPIFVSGPSAGPTHPARLEGGHRPYKKGWGESAGLSLSNWLAKHPRKNTGILQCMPRIIGHPPSG